MTSARMLIEEASAWSFRCADLFDMKSLPNLKLLAGEDKLNNVISRVNIMEVPDIQNWAQANEFLVTTGYSYQNDMNAFLALIPRLVERGVAAFGIKPKRFIAEIPLAVIQCAEEHGLPLFELPESTIFSNVVREVMERVITLETHNILLLQRRLEQISELMLHGHDIPHILALLEAMVGNPICILDAFGRIIASPAQADYFNALGDRLRSFDARSSPKQSKMTLNGENGQLLSLHVFNLWETERDPILVLLPEKNGSCSELDLSTVSRILPLLNIRLSGENTYKLVRAKYLDDFLKDWLMGFIPSSEDLDMKGRLYGCGSLSDKHYRVAIVKFNSGSQPVPDSAILNGLNRSEQNSPYLFTALSGKLIALVPERVGNCKLTQEEMEPLAHIISSVCGTPDFSLCIGEPYGPLKLHEGYADTENLYTASCVSKENRQLVTWEQLGIYAVLSLLPKHANINKFLSRFIQPMISYDQTHHSSLIQTLQIYFRMGCNIKLTAQAMFTHYNTVVYRLDKIKTILGISFDDPEALLQLQLGLKIYEMGE